MIIAIILFAVTYILMLSFAKYRAYIALCCAALFIALGILPLGDVAAAVDFNVLMMIAGTMGLVKLFIDSNMPARLADMIMNRVPTIQAAAVFLALFAGIISAFVDNVATVLMIAPIALSMCKKMNTNPIPFIIAMAVSSNLQGAATLVGDTTAIMLGSHADMTFLNFFVYNGKPSIFFAVELGAIMSAIVLAFLFRNKKERLEKFKCVTPVEDYVPTILLVLCIASLISASFWKNKPELTNGVICIGLAIVGIVYSCIRKKSVSPLLSVSEAIDVETIGLLFGLFIVISGVEHVGIIDAFAEGLAKLGSGNVFLLYNLIVWGSVVISAFIDNIPYVATMLPVITGLSSALGIQPTLFYFGLLSGATLGGNCTPIGASANITAIGILDKQGYKVKIIDFMRIGIPFTLAAIIPSYIYIWIVFGI